MDVEEKKRFVEQARRRMEERRISFMDIDCTDQERQSSVFLFFKMTGEIIHAQYGRLTDLERQSK